jgi:hypothetical protein
MKQVLIFVLSFIISLSINAQGKSGGKGKGKVKDDQVQTNNNGNNNDTKGKEKVKDKNKKEDKGSKNEKEIQDDKEKKEHDKKVWEGTSEDENDGPKPSKNQPAKVRESFARDYPNAQNVSWSKYRGDWTATFRNGTFTSTAVYHANGERRDTRTPVPQQEVPRNILEEVIKKRPQTQPSGEVIKVELPEKNRHLFRFKEIINGAAKYFFIDNNGNEVNYKY